MSLPNESLRCPGMMQQSGLRGLRASQSDQGRCSPEGLDILVSGCVLPILPWKGTLHFNLLRRKPDFMRLRTCSQRSRGAYSLELHMAFE